MSAGLDRMKTNPKKGAFIAFEGLDGSGKSTQLKLFAKRLKSIGADVCETSEPTDGAIGKLIRGVLAGKYEMDERAIAALFAADRLDHLLGIGGIREKIDRGAIVVTDRYYLSSYAYQSSAMPLEWVMNINSQAVKLLKPACHIFIDISPEKAVERIAGGREKTELFETIERLADVRKKYFEVFDVLKLDENIIVVDGEAAKEKVSENIWKTLRGYVDC